MPYSGPGDAKLPDLIKKLSEKIRRQWVNVWNSVFRQTGDEGRAFAAANGAIKELDMAEELNADNADHEDSQEGDKCVEVMAMPAYGGATSFAEVDSYREGLEVDMAVDKQYHMFDEIVRNIRNALDMEPAERVRLIEQAARELSNRILHPPEEKSLWDKVTDMFTGQKVTKTEGGVSYPASDFADVPDRAKPSTWKLRLAEGRPGNYTVDQVARAITALQPGGFRGNVVRLGQARSTVIGRIKSTIGKIAGASDDQRKALNDRLTKVKEVEAPGGVLTLMKDRDGAWRWLAVFSNKFFDRDEEVFPEAAHKEYEEWVDQTGLHPELRLWHVPGSRIGQADFVAYDDNGFMLSSGTFDKGMEDVAGQLAEDDSISVSHGFRYERDEGQEEVYAAYRTFEVSVLPAEWAANPWTAFTVNDMIKEVSMQDEKRAFLVEKLGEDRTKRVEDQLSVLGKELEGAGIAWKDVLAENGPETKAETAIQDPSATTPTADPPAAEAAAETPTANATQEGPKNEAGDEEPAGEAKGINLEQLEQVLSQAIDAKIAPLAEIVTTIQSELKGLKKSSDEQVADAMAPRAAVTTAEKPTQDADNVMTEEEGNKATEEAGKDDQQRAVSPYLAMLNGAKVPPIGQ